MTAVRPDLRPWPHVDGVVHHFVDIVGARLHVAEAGAGPPVVLLHTMPQHWYAWRKVIPLLAGEYRLLCLDLRGAGSSDAPRRGYGTADRVADVLGALDALGVSQADVIGHGYGAWTAFALATRAPDRVGHLLALSELHPWVKLRHVLPRAWRFWHTAAWEYPVLGSMMLAHVPGFTRWLLRHWSADSAALEAQAVEEFVRSSAEPARAHAGQQLNWSFVTGDIPGVILGRARSRLLSTQTVLLIGERDPLIRPAMVRRHHSSVQELTVKTVIGAGHLLPEEAPDEVASAARSLFGVCR